MSFINTNNARFAPQQQQQQPRQQQHSPMFAPAYPNQNSQIGGPLRIGSPLDGDGWGTPVWAWVIMFILALAVTGMAIAILVKVCQLHPKKNASECYDGNKCTVDYKFRGGCFSLDCPSDEECDNSCYTSGGWSHCKNGECIGTGCIGQCEIADDCPELATSDLVSGFDTVVCRLGRCMYEVTEPVFIDFASTCGGTFVEQECRALISDTEPLKDCLALDTFCKIDADKKRSITSGVEDEDEDEESMTNELVEKDIDTVARGCIFRFACAEVIIP